MILFFSKRTKDMLTCSGISYKLLDTIPISNNVGLANANFALFIKQPTYKIDKTVTYKIDKKKKPFKSE